MLPEEVSCAADARELAKEFVRDLEPDDEGGGSIATQDYLDLVKAIPQEFLSDFEMEVIEAVAERTDVWIEYGNPYYPDFRFERRKRRNAQRATGATGKRKPRSR